MESRFYERCRPSSEAHPYHDTTARRVQEQGRAPGTSRKEECEKGGLQSFFFTDDFWYVTRIY